MTSDKVITKIKRVTFFFWDTLYSSCCGMRLKLQWIMIVDQWSRSSKTCEGVWLLWWLCIDFVKPQSHIFSMISINLKNFGFRSKWRYCPITRHVVSILNTPGLNSEWAQSQNSQKSSTTACKHQIQSSLLLISTSVQGTGYILYPGSVKIGRDHNGKKRVIIASLLRTTCAQSDSGAIWCCAWSTPRNADA